MIAADTNVVVRLLTHDDEDQYQKAYKFLQRTNVFLPDTVILETEWVLRYAYDFEVDQIAQAIRKLLGLPNVKVAHAARAAQVLDWYEQGLDFADAFHLAASEETDGLRTFDTRFVKRAARLKEQPCPVKQL